MDFFFYFLQIRLLLSIAAVATGRAASCICSPVTRHVLFLVIPTSTVPPAFKLLILFSVSKCRRQKTTKIIKSSQLTSSTRIGVFRVTMDALENRKSSGLDYKIHNSHLCPVPLCFLARRVSRFPRVSMGRSNISGSATAAAALFIWTILFQISPDKGLMQFEME